jgi:hypothetical protein
MPFAIIVTQLCRGLDEQPEDHCAVIIRERDQLSLHDQTAQLDQVPGALSPFHLPVPPIMPRLAQR